MSMSDDAKKPDLKIISDEELDEEEREYRALRRDLPGAKGAADIGMLTISVGRQPTPKNVFYRTHKTFRPVVPLVNVEVGMDRHFIAVMPNMIEPLASIGITVTDHILYLTITPEGGLRIVPVRGPNAEGEQNEWDRTKEMALIEAMNGWVRMYTDKVNKAYMSFSCTRRSVWRTELAGYQARQDHADGVSRQGPVDREQRTHIGAKVGRS